jgi:hypothetical protein
MLAAAQMRLTLGSEEVMHMAEKDWDKALEGLEKLRDEIKLKAHLLKADLKDEWVKLDRDFEKLRAELAPVRRAVGESAKDVGAAVRLLFDSVKEGFERVQAARKS